MNLISATLNLASSSLSTSIAVTPNSLNLCNGSPYVNQELFLKYRSGGDRVKERRKTRHQEGER